jgi:hypothetical protein
MPIRRSAWLTVIAGTLAIYFLVPAPSPARTWYVKADSTGDAPTIKAGLDSATFGDTVLVAPGIYLRDGDTNPGSGETLLSEGGPEVTVIEFCGITIGVALYQCEGARLSGFTIRFAERPGCSWPGGSTEGVSCYQCTDVVVENCIIEDVMYGIYVSGESQEWYEPVLRDNVIRNCHTGIYCRDVAEPSRPHLLGNSITYCDVGVEVLNSEPRVEACEIMYCEDWGMHYWGACGGNVKSSVIAHNLGDGVYINTDPEPAVPHFNGSWLPEEANDIYDNAGWDIWYAHSCGNCLVMAIYNYWGSNCPDFEGKIHGRVDYSPWMDSTHTQVLTEDDCPEASDPSTWGNIKAMFR